MPRLQLTPKQFTVVATLLWAVAIVTLVPLTPLTIAAAAIVGVTATPIFFYSMALLIVDYKLMAEAKLNHMLGNLSDD